MKNPAPYIREQLAALLDGTVSYDSVLVPAFEEGSEGKEPYKILIAGMSPYRRDTKVSRTYEYTQTVEVLYEGRDNTRRHVDAIAEGVMQLIQPTLTTKGIADSAAWQITGLNVNAPRYLSDVSASGVYIKRAILEIDFKITER